MPFVPPGLESLAADLFGRAVGKIAESSPDPLMRSVLQWVATVQANVVTRWRPIVASGMRCALRPRAPNGAFVPCREPAIGSCGFCHQPTCLRHALIDEQANVLCHQCVAQAAKVMNVQPGAGSVGASSEAPPRDPHAEREQRMKRRTALRVMGVEEDVTPEELNRVFRQLMLEHHPDRAKSEKDRLRRQDRVSKITAAYHYLKDHPRGERSAA